MTDKEFLSKYKYIYVITCDGDRLHCEKFPVIYLNLQYVYYRQNGCDELKKICFGSVRDTIDDADLVYLDRYGKRYVWNVPKDFNEKNAEYMNDVKKKKLKITYERLKKDCEYAKRRFKEAEEKLYKLESSMNADEN